MKTTKTTMKFFTVAQHEEEAEYLTKMHSEGWALNRVGFPCFYHFVKVEPEKVVYQLDYNQDSVKNKNEYVQMFADCGWTYMFDFVGYSYFKKAAADMKDGDESIFCDDESRLDMIKRVMQGRVIPLIAVFFCVIVPQLLQYGFGYNIAGNHQKLIFWIFVVLTLIYIFNFAAFAHTYFKFKKRVHSNK